MWWKVRDRALSTRQAPQCSVICSCGHFPEGEPNADIDISLHYVLVHRHDQPVAAGYTPVLPKSPFTITNDPVKSPILDTMLQRICIGTVVRGAIKITLCTDYVIRPKQSSFASLMARHGSSLIRWGIRVGGPASLR